MRVYAVSRTPGGPAVAAGREEFVPNDYEVQEAYRARDRSRRAAKERARRTRRQAAGTLPKGK